MGFQLVELKLSGTVLPDAVINFTSGLNVITGPSDTGKSFILECIDYVLGRQKCPKPIKEAAGYSTASLKIKKNTDDEVISLSRKLTKAGKKITALLPTGELLELSPKHSQKNSNNISSFLLELTGLSGKKLKKNQRNETIDLSFRHLANLIFVNEKRVVTDESPFFSGVTTSRTVERSLLNLLLTGEDDEGLTEIEDAKISKAKAAARSEVALSLIEKHLNSIPDRFQTETIAILSKQVSDLAEKREAIELEMDEFRLTVDKKEEEQGFLQRTIVERESKLRNLKDLNERFNLLGQQYEADLLRVDAVAEAASAFSVLNQQRCSICGSPAEYHSEEHTCDVGSIADACSAEKLKTELLHKELITAKLELTCEILDLEKELAELMRQRSSVNAELDELLKPRLGQYVKELLKTNELSNLLSSIIEKKEQLKELNEMIDPVIEGNVVEAVNGEESLSLFYDQLSQLVLEVLKSWHFPEADRVSFSEKLTEFDFIINGRPRNSHGKGVRAVLLTSAMTALFKYCKRDVKNHTGFLVIDSPLVVYREPDPGETLNDDVKKSLYENLSTDFKRDQIVIIENVEPPQGIDANIIRFTKGKTGRYGFIPVG
jgi:DNA repair exonuclease SbcCD ATPase subunit